MRKLLTIALALSASCFTTAAFAADTSKPHGEFDNNCAMAMATGKEFKTDCSVNWKDSTSGKTYCFGNEEMKKQWSQNTSANIKKAQEMYASKHSQGSDDHAAHGTTSHGSM